MRPDSHRKGSEVGLGRAAVAAGLLGSLILLVTASGCASKPTPPPTPTKQEVMSDSDRFFEKMKEDELRHGKGTRQDLQ